MSLDGAIESGTSKRAGDPLQRGKTYNEGVPVPMEIKTASDERKGDENGFDAPHTGGVRPSKLANSPSVMLHRCMEALTRG